MIGGFFFNNNDYFAMFVMLIMASLSLGGIFGANGWVETNRSSLRLGWMNMNCTNLMNNMRV